MHDYETAAFYIDAAVSEDLKFYPGTTSTPALLLFLVIDSDHRQALGEHVRTLRTEIDQAIIAYNRRPDAAVPPIGFADLQTLLLQPAIKSDNEHLRTLVTTFISFFLEWDHRLKLIQLRTEKGTGEPFFIHLFKGCVLFESLLKANPKKQLTSQKLALGKVLKELHSELGFGARNTMEVGGFDFQTIINDIPADEDSVFIAIERTGRIRNTTGHNLGWQVSLDAPTYNSLAGYVATACLHAIVRLYR